MAKGDASISSIYRLGETTTATERERRRDEREQSLFQLLWLKHGLICIRSRDLPDNDPLAQHVINIANQKYGRRTHGTKT